HSAQKALDFLGARHLALNDNLAIDRQGWRAHYPCVDDGVGVGNFFHVVGFVQGPGGGLGVGGELFAFGAATAVDGEFHGACLLGWGERINTSCRKRSRWRSPSPPPGRSTPGSSRCRERCESPACWAGTGRARPAAAPGRGPCPCRRPSAHRRWAPR